MDQGKLIGEIVQRFGVKLDKDDPAFLLVELNRLVLEQAGDDLAGKLGELPGQVEAAGQRMLAELATRVTKQIDGAEAEAAKRVKGEVDEARKVAAELIGDVAKANRNVNASKWFAVAGVVCLSVFVAGAGAGYWVGVTSAEKDQSRAAAVLASDQGAAAVRLAELGQARQLLNCSADGWTKRDDFCYGTAGGNGRTVGWRIR